MKYIYLIVFIFSSILQLAYAFDGMTVLKVSNSGSTIILDRGHLEGIKIGDTGRLVFQEGIDKPKMSYIAQAQAIKVHDKYSFWLLTNVDNSQLVIEGQKLLFAKMEDILKGREVTMRRKRIILPQSKSVIQYLRDDEIGMPDELIYKGHDYIETDEIVDTAMPSNEHLEVRSFEDWKVQYGLDYIDDYMQEIEKKYISGNAPNVDNDLIANRHDRNVFQSVISGVNQKINNLDYGLSGLYHDQRRDEEIKIITDRVQVENLYEKVHREKRDKVLIEPYAKEKIRIHGERWSSDLDSKELRRFFINSGISKERRRQALALDTKEGNELLFRMASGLVNHTSAQDINHQGTGYSLSAAYEFHLSRTTLSLDRFSLEFGMEQAIRYFDMGGVNGRFTEGSFYIGLNYYFINKAHNIDKYLWYVGAGLRRGNATAQSSELTTDYTYQFTSTPSLQLGLKYRFFAGDERNNAIRIGLGYNFLISSEILRYSVNETIVDDIDGLFSANDIRVFAGLSVYF